MSMEHVGEMFKSLPAAKKALKEAPPSRLPRKNFSAWQQPSGSSRTLWNRHSWLASSSNAPFPTLTLVTCRCGRVKVET
jgi:hypothetical protein